MKKIGFLCLLASLLVAGLASPGKAAPPAEAWYADGVLCVRAGTTVSCTPPIDVSIPIIPSVFLGEDGLCVAGPIAGQKIEPICTGPIPDPVNIDDYSIHYNPGNPEEGVCLESPPASLCTGPLMELVPEAVSYDPVSGICVHNETLGGGNPKTCTGPITEELLADPGSISFDHDTAELCVGPPSVVGTAGLEDEEICTPPIDVPLDDDLSLPNVAYTPDEGVCIQAPAGIRECSGSLEPTPLPNPKLNLQLTTPTGVPMADAQVAVYILPFNPPATYVPVKLASGRASWSGNFSADVNMDLVRAGVGVPLDSGVREINTLVEAVTPDKRWLVTSTVIVSLTGDTTEALQAKVDLPSAVPDIEKQTIDSLIGIARISCVGSPDPDGGDPFEGEVDLAGYDESQEDPHVDPCPPSEDEVLAGPNGCSNYCKIDDKRRWQRVEEFHSAPGIKGTFQWRQTRETRAESAVRYNQQAWHAGGWMVEQDQRGSERKLGAEATHRRVLARYWWKKYWIEHTPCIDCSRVIEEK